MANYKRNMKTSSPLAHWYLGLINCGVAAVLFTAEVSAGGIGISNPPLINVNFGGHLTPAGLNINKVGIAAIGQATNDIWNFYSRDVAPGQWRQNGAITNLHANRPIPRDVTAIHEPLGPGARDEHATACLD